MISVALIAIVVQPKAVVEAKDFDKLFSKVEEIGQVLKVEPTAAKFAGLAAKEARTHSKFDTERRVQAVREKKGRFLLFFVPEKPFPEFGKTWLYCVGEKGLVSKAGVCPPREAYKSLPADEGLKGSKKEADYWMKELKL